MSRQLTLGGEPHKTLWMKSEKGKIVGQAKCGPTPPGEIVVRSAYCNLKCIPCFAYSYSWPEYARKNKEVVEVSLGSVVGEFHDFLKYNPPKGTSSYNWFRILGGEPFLNEEYLDAYIDIISNIDANDLDLVSNRILVQTNGIILGKLAKETLAEKFGKLRKTNSKIVVEVSIKGSNPLEFSILTQRREDVSKTLFRQHIEACENIEYVHSRVPNVDWTAVAGFGVGVINLKSQNLENTRYIKTFYHPNSNSPFYHPDNWDSAFANLFSAHVQKYQERFGDKFPMFGIEDRWKSCLHGLRNCSKFGGKYYYDRFTTHRNSPNSELEKHIEEITKYFFFGDPGYYYVRLFD